MISKKDFRFHVCFNWHFHGVGLICFVAKLFLSAVRLLSGPNQSQLLALDYAVCSICGLSTLIFWFHLNILMTFIFKHWERIHVWRNVSAIVSESGWFSLTRTLEALDHGCYSGILRAKELYLNTAKFVRGQNDTPFCNTRFFRQLCTSSSKTWKPALKIHGACNGLV